MRRLEEDVPCLDADGRAVDIEYPEHAGGRVVTYDGWPLYTYVTDTAAGQANGQALNLNGGLWYVISPSGKVIKKKP